MKFLFVLLFSFLSVYLATIPNPPNTAQQLDGACEGVCVNSTFITQQAVMPSCGRIVLNSQSICLKTGYTLADVREFEFFYFFYFLSEQTTM
jgi:hypothetical protein